MVHFLFVPTQEDLQLPLNRRRQPCIVINTQIWPALVAQNGNCKCALDCHHVHRLYYLYIYLYLVSVNLHKMCII